MSDSQWKRVHLDPEKLIKAIKKRTMLYDKEDPHYYYNKRQKAMCWQEVSKEVIPNWESMRPQERVECYSQWKRVHLDPEKLIKAIKKRTMLYDKEDPHYYHNKRQKAMCWQEVSKEVIPNWESMRPQERVECCHELQKRWKSLRTCFGREVSEQRKEERKRKKNLLVRRRKTYGYFNLMSFLLPTYNISCRPIKESDNEESNDRGDDDNDDEDMDEDPLESAIKAESYEGTSRHEPIMLESDTFQQIYEPNQSSDGKIIDYLKDVKKDEDDEDKQFLMSLIPTFRKFNDKQKFEARIEILKVLKEISFRHEAGPSTS